MWHVRAQCPLGPFIQAPRPVPCPARAPRRYRMPTLPAGHIAKRASARAQLAGTLTTAQGPHAQTASAAAPCIATCTAARPPATSLSRSSTVALCTPSLATVTAHTDTAPAVPQGCTAGACSDSAGVGTDTQPMAESSTAQAALVTEVQHVGSDGSAQATLLGTVGQGVDVPWASYTDEEWLRAACAGTLLVSSAEHTAVLRTALLAAMRGAAALDKRGVENAGRLMRRVRSDLGFLDRCLAARAAQPAPQVLEGTISSQPALSLPSTAAASPASPSHASNGPVDQTCADTVFAAAATAACTDNAANTHGGAAQHIQRGDEAAGAAPALNSSSGGVSRIAKALTPERVRGLWNNLRGYSGELLAAQLAPDVIAVGKRFHAIPCQTTPAPGAAHSAVVAARRQRIEDNKQRQKEASKLQLATDSQSTEACHTASASAGTIVSGPHAARTSVHADANGAAPPAHSSATTAHTNTSAPPAHPNTAASARASMLAAAPTRATATAHAHTPSATDDSHHLTEATASSAPTASIRAQAPGSATATTAHAHTTVSDDPPHVRAAPPARAPVHAHTPSATDDSHHLTLTVEVDVVCAGGSVWLEVKAQESFTVDSEHWLGTRPGNKGLKRQVEDLLFVAQQTCNHIRWTPPHVCVLFPCGHDPGVVAALQDMGAVVLVGMVNLDTTTLCALVSQPGDADVERWAARTPQWRDCVSQEQEDPILPHLTPYLTPDRPLIAADLAVSQFDTLVDMHAGPIEQQRWQELRSRLRIINTQTSNTDLPCEGSATATAAATQSGSVSARLQGLGDLREVGRQQVAVFGVGDSHKAVTLTANGAAVRSLARQGVHVESVVHRAVWLTGL